MTDVPQAVLHIDNLHVRYADGVDALATVRTLRGRFGQVAISRLELGWVAPNSAFDPTGPDAPGATLRLAWVVEARTSGALADSLRAVKLFFDAGTGALIGGDVLR